MWKKSGMLLAGTLSLLAGSAPSYATPSDGYFVDHQQAVERGGVGNYSPEHGQNYYRHEQAGSEPKYSSDTGLFVDHNTALAMGAVGNYVTSSEARRYDRHLAEARQVAIGNSDEGVVFFGFDQASLNQDSKQEIAKIADELKQDRTLAAEVVGFTDDIGGQQYNQKLSEERAGTVKDALLNSGVHSEQVVISGYGESEPVASNESDTGRSANRRAEIYIEPLNKATS